MNRIEPIAPPGVHDKVMEIVRTIPGSRILDVPTGYGALTEQLRNLGREVTAGDIDIAKFRGTQTGGNVTLVQLDLNDPTLPLGSDSFDIVISVEGIEHLQNQWTFVRSLHRVLKPDGRLIVTTPNILNIRSRIRYLLEGRFEHFKRPLVKGRSWDRDLQNYHISPISFFELQFMLDSCGFEIMEIHTNRYRARNVLTRLLRPLFTLFYRHKNYRDNKRDRGNYRDLYRKIMSKEIFYGECLVVVAKKPARTG